MAARDAEQLEEVTPAGPLARLLAAGAAVGALAGAALGAFAGITALAAFLGASLGLCIAVLLPPWSTGAPVDAEDRGTLD